MIKNIFLIALITLIFIPTAQAEEADGSQIFVAPGSLYQNNAARVNQVLKERSFSKTDKQDVGNVQISLVHHHYMDADQFGILMKLADVSSGCFELSPLEYEANFIDNNYMDIKIKNFRRKVMKTENPEFDCNQGSKVVSGLVVLSAKELKKRGVREIRFDNGQVRDAYVVTIKKDSIVLKPDSMIAFKAQGLTGPDKDKLVHYFGGKGMVAVHVPMANKGEDIAQRVRTLAYKNSLTPIFEQEGLDTSGDGNVFYFMDPQGKTLGGLNEDGYTELGTIQVTRPYIGPNGRQGLPTPLKVFATRPGTTL